MSQANSYESQRGFVLALACAYVVISGFLIMGGSVLSSINHNSPGYFLLPGDVCLFVFNVFGLVSIYKVSAVPSLTQR